MTLPHHSRLLLASMLLLCRPAIGLTITEGSFDRYKIILSRMPFGDAPPDLVPEPVPIPAAESFAKSLRVCSIMEEDETGEVKVGIVDSQSNKVVMYLEGEMKDGIEMLSANIEKEEVVLQKGSEIVRLNMAGEVTTMSGDDLAAQRRAVQTKPAAPTPKPTMAQASYQDRRKMRQDRRRLQEEKERESKRLNAERRAAAEARRAKYTGEELRQQLQDYNMEAIRQGMPALPLELTQQQDDQLVAEHILPPRDAIQEAIATGESLPNDNYDEAPGLEELPLEELPLEELLLEERILEEVLGLPEVF